jgi:hypothetical protein
MKANGFSATCCGEPLKNPILPIVYLLIAPARYLVPPQPKRRKARAEMCHIYIHIKTKTFIYIGDLFCLYLGNFTYLLSLIILYFSYACGLCFVSRHVSCDLQGNTLTGRYTLNGRHSRKNLPVLWGNAPQPKGELRSSPQLRLASSAVQPNQTHSSNADYPSHKAGRCCETPTSQPTTWQTASSAKTANPSVNHHAN